MATTEGATRCRSISGTASRDALPELLGTPLLLLLLMPEARKVDGAALADRCMGCCTAIALVDGVADDDAFDDDAGYGTEDGGEETEERGSAGIGDKFDATNGAPAANDDAAPVVGAEEDVDNGGSEGKGALARLEPRTAAGSGTRRELKDASAPSVKNVDDGPPPLPPKPLPVDVVGEPHLDTSMDTRRSSCSWEHTETEHRRATSNAF